jgi:G0-opsin
VFGWIGCRWYGWAGFFFGCGSLITMTAVSLDRYLKICYLSYGKLEGFLFPDNQS